MKLKLLEIVKEVEDRPHIKLGSVGQVVEVHNYEGNEYDINLFDKNGDISVRLFGVGAESVKETQDEEWYDAWEKYAGKHVVKPYIKARVEFMSIRPMFGVWMVADGREHRLLGTEGMNAKPLIEYWDGVARHLDTILYVDPYIQAAITDEEAGDEKYTNMNMMHARRFMKALEKQKQ